MQTSQFSRHGVSVRGSTVSQVSLTSLHHADLSLIGNRPSTGYWYGRILLLQATKFPGWPFQRVERDL